MISVFVGCSNDSSSGNVNDSEVITEIKYILLKGESKDIPIDAKMLAQSTDTKVKIVRDVESNTTMNIEVLSGSVEITE